MVCKAIYSELMSIFTTGIMELPYNNCNSMKIFIDNGHGQFTPGKRSPDGQLREAFYNREMVMVQKVVGNFDYYGLDLLIFLLTKRYHLIKFL